MSLTTSHLLANVQEQKDKVFAFARTLGKCEAVIKTAARVAREAALAFEASCLNSHSKQSTSASHSYRTHAHSLKEEASSMNRAMTELCRAHGLALDFAPHLFCRFC